MAQKGRGALAWRFLALGLAVVWGLASAAGRELHVPTQYPTIQAALDAASPGDRITIAPGTYVENLAIGKRDLTLAGADPATMIVQAKFPDLPVVTIRERNITLLGAHPHRRPRRLWTGSP